MVDFLLSRLNLIRKWLYYVDIRQCMEYESVVLASLQISPNSCLFNITPAKNLCTINRRWSTKITFGIVTVENFLSEIFIHHFSFQWDLKIHIHSPILNSILFFRSVFFIDLAWHLATVGQFSNRNIMSDNGTIYFQMLVFIWVKYLFKFGHFFT